MKPIQSSLLRSILSSLPKKFAKENIKYVEKDRNLLNLYDRNKEFITSIDPSSLKEDVFQTDLVKVGRPSCKTYFLRRCAKRISMCPIGSSYWYYLPYETQEDVAKFLSDVDARGESKGIVSDLFTNGSVLVRIPSNREPYLKDIFKKGETANPYKKLKEAVEYSTNKFKLLWRI
jgi:hypothetical protein